MIDLLLNNQKTLSPLVRALQIKIENWEEQILHLDSNGKELFSQMIRDIQSVICETYSDLLNDPQYVGTTTPDIRLNHIDEQGIDVSIDLRFENTLNLI
jgi:hypothetical protein